MSNEDLEGLENLGVSVQNLETLESELIGRLEEKIKLKEQETVVKQVKKELRPLCDRIKDCIKKKRKCEKLIRTLHESNSTLSSQQHRQITSLLDDQVNFEERLSELFTHQNNILNRLKDCQYEYEKDPEILRLVVKNRTTEPEQEFEANEAESETDLQRNIRLGDVTAFGNTLQTQSNVDGAANFDQYLQQQLQSQQPGPSRKRKENSDSGSDSGFVEVPLPKRTKGEKSKKKLRPLYDEEEVGFNPDDSDWEGSDDEGPLIKKKPVKKSSKPLRPLYDEEEVGFKTDDSDWEGTDEEEEIVVTKRRKHGDDGDRDMYLARVASWQANRTEEDKALDGRYEELEGGLKVPSCLWDKLYNYQKVGVQWMFELHQQKCGGILGDEMGLGKTIQVISFLASLSYSQVLWPGGSWRGLGPSLILCPSTLLHQWVAEFHKWWPPLRVAVLHSSGSHSGSKKNLISAINGSGGVLIMSYQAITATLDTLNRFNWHYVILDEGHKIRNPDAKVTLCVKQLATCHRLILSGSPMQNNLKELWSLFDFIYPGKLGTLPVFLQQFSTPITQGGYANASTVQVATAYKCATVLKDTISPYLLRRMKEDVKNHINLPEKNEQVLFCRLTEEQRQLYRSYIDGSETKQILTGQLKVFVGLIALRKICNHPDLFSGAPKPSSDIEEEHSKREARFGYYKRSGKMIVVHSLLKLWKRQGHRVLLFSQSQMMLTVIENYVRDHNYKYLRLDGTTPVGSRQKMISEFNAGDHFVFILTTKVGGLGVNLTGANRVVIFDPDWNPSTDTQARERSWRIGQDKQVTIYRLMTSGTIEEKIYHRQIFKQFLVNRILKDPKQRRFFKSNDLYELFTLTEATKEDDTETSAIFAGTGANIKPKAETSSYSVPVFKPSNKRAKEVDGANTDVHQSLTRLYKEESEDIVKEDCQDDDRKGEKCSSLSDELREKLREQARRISAKLSKPREASDESSKTEAKRVHKKHKRKKKKEKDKDKKFEGVKVPHLVKKRKFKAPLQNEEEEAKVSESQDNYVLAKLFAKSGVHSALQHDAIVDNDTPDFAIIESEANELAKKAIKAMKESRRDCLRADAGVPNWTGSNGGLNKPRFGPKKKKPPGPNMSSTELLSIMRSRNMLVSSVDKDDDDHDNDDLFRPDDAGTSSHGDNHGVDQAHMDLLADVRNFVAFQAEVDGEASTAELVNKFKRSLPSQQSPLFKAFLQQICDFSRNHEGKGIWKLKRDFR